MLFNLLQADIRATMDMIDQLMKFAPQLMNTITSTINGIFSTFMNMFKGFTGVGRVSLEGVRLLKIYSLVRIQLTKTTQNGLTGLFGAFGSLNPKDQKSVANVFSKANHVVLAVTKLQASDLNSAEKEVLPIRQIMESQHKDQKELIAALKSKAPKLTSFVQTAFSKGSAEFSSHAQKLEESARRGLNIVGFLFY